MKMLLLNLVGWILVVVGGICLSTVKDCYQGKLEQGVWCIARVPGLRGGRTVCQEMT